MNSSHYLCTRAMTVLRNMYLTNEKVTSEDAAFLKQHVASCDSCLADSAVLRGVSIQAVSGVTMDLSSERTANAVFRRLREEADQETRRFGARLANGVWLPATVAAAIIVFGFFFVIWMSQDTPSTAPIFNTIAKELKIQRQNLHNEAEVAAAQQSELFSAAQSEDKFSKDESIYTIEKEKRLVLPQGIKLLLGPNTSVSIQSSEAEGTSVLLRHGRLLASVDPNRNGPSFRVITTEGEVKVTGTIFSVTANSNAPQWVEVLRGHVAVTDRRNRVLAVRAGERLMMRDGTLEAMADGDRITLEKSSDRLERSIDVESEIVDLEDSLSPSTVARNVLLDTRDSSSKPRLENPETVTPPPSMRRLLLDVRQYRSGKKWKKLVGAYQNIRLYHPGSTTAFEALVALGEIYLTKFHQPETALNHFNQYLRSSAGAPLVEEALIGKAKSLKTMNRTGEEHGVLQDLKNRYPRSGYTLYVNKRLSDIAHPQNTQQIESQKK